MGTVSRHGNAPFADGEVLSGTELEQDFNTIYNEFNGSIENANIAAAGTANISGLKLANTSVTAAQVAADTLTVTTMAAAAVPKHYVEIDASPGTWTTDTSLADFTGMTGATLTPGSTDDMIFMDVAVFVTITGTAQDVMVIGWHVNGTDYDNIAEQIAPQLNGSSLTFVSTYAIAAPAASSMTIKPRHRRIAGTQTLTIDNIVFRTWILPGKP